MSRYFPLGVRFFYKLYAAEIVIMIEPDPLDKFLGLKAWEVIPKWLPDQLRDDNGNLSKPGGMYILWKLPTKQLLPEPLTEGSHRILMQVYYRVQMSWLGNDENKKYIEDWHDFAKMCPSSDDVDKYIKDQPERFHVPFRQIIFKGTCLTIFM